jgi:hypothetical protein
MPAQLTATGPGKAQEIRQAMPIGAKIASGLPMTTTPLERAGGSTVAAAGARAVQMALPGEADSTTQKHRS